MLFKIIISLIIILLLFSDFKNIKTKIKRYLEKEK
jgi:hypothetical protein